MSFCADVIDKSDYCLFCNGMPYCWSTPLDDKLNITTNDKTELLLIAVSVSSDNIGSHVIISSATTLHRIFILFIYLFHLHRDYNIIIKKIAIFTLITIKEQYNKAVGKTGRELMNHTC